MPQEWFQTWFNSPYYHLLYNQRNNQEAEYFINKLVSYLKPAAGAQLLDIACGRGRHAIYLNKQGYDVTGIDLSIANIHYAREYENATLHFYVHDMRSLFYDRYFDIALNLFTSFGYFKTDEEHIDALKTFNKALKPDGLLVLDFFNIEKVVHTLVPDCMVAINDINFHVQKKMRGQKIIKDITFEDGGKAYHFKEIVSAFSLSDFTTFFEHSGFEVVDYFGNYSLDKFDVDTSDRLIFICKKNNA